MKKVYVPEETKANSSDTEVEAYKALEKPLKENVTNNS